MVKKNYYGYIVLAIVVMVLFSLQQSGGGDVTEVNREQYAREGGLLYDGFDDDWMMSYKSISDVRTIGENLKVKVTVTNVDEDYGTKYVQCSILDAEDNSWLATVERAGIGRETYVLKPRVKYNCDRDEPFTKTAQVGLEAGESQVVGFNIKIPSYPEDHQYVVYCNMFEQCFENKDPLSKYAFAKEIEIDVSEDCGDFDEGNTCYNGDVWHTNECGQATSIDTVCTYGYRCSTGNLHCVNYKGEAICDDECRSSTDVDCKGAHSYNRCVINKAGCYEWDDTTYTLLADGNKYCYNDKIIDKSELPETDDETSSKMARPTIWDWLSSLF